LTPVRCGEKTGQTLMAGSNPSVPRLEQCAENARLRLAEDPSFVAFNLQVLEQFLRRRGST